MTAATFPEMPAHLTLADRIAGVPAADLPAELLAIGKERFRAATDAGWLHAFAEECAAATDIDEHQWRDLASDLAWWVRLRRSDDRDLALEPTGVPTADRDTPYVELIFTAQFLRFDFRFDALEEYLRRYPRRYPESDSLVEAQRLFAWLGGGAMPVTHDQVTEILDAPDCDRRTRHCLLHAMWIATDSTAWADRMIEIGSAMERTGSGVDAVLQYRLAVAHRMLGNHSVAADHIRKALGAPSTDVAVREQYYMELNTISAARETAVSLATLRKDAEQRIDDTLRNGLIANFGLLTIVLAILSAAGTVGVSLVRAAEGHVEWWESGLVALMALVFIVLVLLMVRALLGDGISRSRGHERASS